MKHRRGRDRNGIVRGRGRVRNKEKNHNRHRAISPDPYYRKDNRGKTKPFNHKCHTAFTWSRQNIVRTITNTKFALIDIWLYKKYGNCDFFIQ